MPWRTVVTRPYVLVWRDMGQIARSALVPAGVLALALGLTGAGNPYGGFVYFVALFFLSMLNVDLHRRFLLPGERDVKLRVLRYPANRDWKFFGVLFLYGLFDKSTEVLQLHLSAPPNEHRLYIVGATVLVLFLLLWPRIAFILPAIATDTRGPLRQAWRASRGTYLRFWLAVAAIVPGVLLLLLLAVAIMALTSAISTFEAAMVPLTAAFAILWVGAHVLYTATTANLYARIVQAKPSDD